MAGGGGDGELGIQIAPMLDVMFVLMLFFMVMAGSRKTEAEMGIDLPSDGGAAYNEDKPAQPIYLSINELGEVIYGEGVSVGKKNNRELRELQERLKKGIQQYGDKNPVILLPSDLAEHERIIDVMNACVAAGVRNLSFGTQN